MRVMEFLEDNETGKRSWGRVSAFICLFVHSGCLVYRTAMDQVDLKEFVLYALTWSASTVLLQALTVIKGATTKAPPPPP